MFKSKLSKVIVSLLRRVLGVTRSGAKRLMRAMLRSLMAMGRRARLPVAGFVLPTVTMVLLVVILLTVAITLRSFDRANIARNVRVNQQVLAAATPALDRAKAKIQFLLYEDPQRPTSTPSDAEMYRIMSANSAGSDLYKFGDEERLILKYPVNNGTTLTAAADNPKLPPVQNIGGVIQESEAINTAWRYPVDTNNDGQFDTFTLYGIFFRSPPIDATDATSAVARARKPLDARTPPMSLGALDPDCATAGAGDNVATLVGDSGWYKLDGKLRKSFFVYTVNVPIKQAEAAALGNNYQAFTGTSSISALEYQQDQSRIPLSNNAVVYEDDLDISPGLRLNLNGRILTNSNLLVTGVNNANDVRFFEVSSKGSCFYDKENSRIQVAGNVVNGWAGNTGQINSAVVHLFKARNSTDEPDAAPQVLINSANESITADTSLDVLYNSDAYSRRLNALVQGQIILSPDGANDPVSVKLLVTPPAGSTQPPQSRSDALDSYFRERLRKVPFKEAALGSDGGVADPTVTPYTAYIQGSGDSLRPIDAWSLPTTGNALVGSAGGPTGLTLDLTQLPSRNPERIGSSESEINLGERVLVGNNLPAQRWDATQSKFLGTTVPQDVGGPTWTGGEPGRTRRSQVTKIADVGATDRGNGWGEGPGSATPPFRDGFWEAAAAQTPRNPLEGTGGLRVITSGGVYDRTNSFLPPPRWNDGISKRGPAPFAANPGPNNTYNDPATAAAEQYPVVWPDTMPMSPLETGSEVFDNVGGNWTNFPADISTATAATSAASSALPGITESASARKFAKGDLRMRATAVYHYAFNGYNPDAITGTAQPTQQLYACVSSYYDPSDASRARNITEGLDALPTTDVSGQGERAPMVARREPTLGSRQRFIGSNNGITYSPTGRTRPASAATVGGDGVLIGGDAGLNMQASLVFPDGRFANGPLRTALLVADDARTLAQKAAIDSTNCALDILSGAIAPNPDLIPHGAIEEVAFLNGREIKAIERDDVDTPTVNEAFTLSGPIPLTPATRLQVNYNQPLEERLPLEIRATQLDIDVLRGATPVAPVAGEWLLPNSGIIYASRDDALPDRSDRTGTLATGLDQATSKRVSPSDSTLDPTRKPNGIVLINGDFLFRNGNDTPADVTSVAEVVKEKGLTLVSNLPVYIQGRFNAHGQIPPATGSGPPPTFTQVEEFETTVNADWSNFYNARPRADLDPDFACRRGDPRLPLCNGDYWRPANVLADSVTLLSRQYRFGFRNEGDFDLRNNAGAEAVLRRRQRGFFNNNFVTNGLSSGAFLANGNLKAPADAITLTDATYRADARPPISSSYFNNFVTPVQRRAVLPEYLMEVCTRLPLSECEDDDWFIDPLGVSSAGTPVRAPLAATTYEPLSATNLTTSFQAGSTYDPPARELQRFPRRVAFLRAANLLVTPENPQPLAIANGANVAPVPDGNAPPAPDPTRDNSLWFVGQSGGTPDYTSTTPFYRVNTDAIADGTLDGSNTPLPDLEAAATADPDPTALKGTQPLLLPFPQNRDVRLVPGGLGGATARETGWLARAENTTFNLVIAAGDTPSQNLNGTVGEFNGGLQNLPRFLESWFPGGATTDIKGSFIQVKRSAFSTAPYQSMLEGIPLGSTAADSKVSLYDRLNPPGFPSPGIRLDYNVTGTLGVLPYFVPPTRNWGYDVGLLPQPPDLFTQRFTTPPSTSQPAEFFREVAGNDPWVKTLMCGLKEQGGTPATSAIPQTECSNFPY